MPCVHQERVIPEMKRSVRPELTSPHRSRQEHVAGEGFASEFRFGLVHQPISVRDAMKVLRS